MNTLKTEIKNLDGIVEGGPIWFSTFAFEISLENMGEKKKFRLTQVLGKRRGKIGGWFFFQMRGGEGREIKSTVKSFKRSENLPHRTKKKISKFSPCLWFY